MLQLADCGLKDLKALRACNRLWEGIPLDYDTGYPHDGRADNAAYRHDRRADKRRYPHDREIDIQILKKMFKNGYIFS